MSHASPPESGPPRSYARKRTRTVLTGLLLLCGGAFAWLAAGGPGTATVVEKLPVLGKFSGHIQGDKQAGKPAQAAGNPAAMAAGGGRQTVSILVEEAQEKPIQVRFDGLGTVQPMAQVVLRSRLDSQIETVHVHDGAMVQEGELLFTLDSRQLQAQTKQAEATMSRNLATLEGARRDVERIGALVERDVSARKMLDDARTKVDELRAQTAADQALVDNLKVQMGYAQIRAPISGRFGIAGLKAGAVVRQGEATTVLGTIVQSAPIYVAFGVPQRLLGELRVALASTAPTVSITGAGLERASQGKVAFLDNSIDQATGMIMARAIIDNKDDNLWPGALVNVRLAIRDELRVIVPASAIQSGQNGTYAYVIKDNVAQMRPVGVDRTQDGSAIIASGLKAGEIVAIDGQMMLTNGAAVTIRKPQAAQKPAS